MKIDEIIKQIIEVEGGYVNHPNDRGGATKFGITEKVAREFGYLGDMQDLSLDFACKIYKNNYVIAPKFDKIHDINQEIAAELIDTGINMGTAKASKFLQAALNICNNNAKIYTDITVDGIIGDNTLNTLKVFLSKFSVSVMLKILNGLQFTAYVNIVNQDPTQECFFVGWLKRVF